MTTTDKAAPKLKRCPACGAKHRDDGPFWQPPRCGWFVVCESCGIKGPGAMYRDGAIAAWNAPPRRKRVGRKKAEAAVTELTGAWFDLGYQSARLTEPTPAIAQAADRTRARLMAMLTGEAAPTVDGAP